MAVELRCPDCRAKLKLKAAPEPGTEVECPECYAVFEAPADGGRAEADDDTPPPRPKKKPAADEDDRPKKKPKKERKERKEKKGKPPEQTGVKKRRAKKKETNKALMAMLVGGGLLFLAVVIGMLVWYVKRKPSAYELMNYLPPDATSVQGANLGHVRKYVEFYKKFESNVNATDFKKAGDAVAKAVGLSADDFIDYMVTGANAKGDSAIVLKAHAAFDGSLLSKLPGAKQGNAGGRTFYTVDPIPGVYAGRLRVFAPTTKLVVICPDAINQGTFNKMIAAADSDADSLLPARLGNLGATASKGTAWTVILLDSSNKPKAPDKNAKEAGTNKDFEELLASSTQSAKGFGLKFSVRSRTVRFEAMLQFPDSDAAQTLLDKYRDSPLAKSDDASTEPPRYWKQFQSSVISSQKVGTELFGSLSAKRSGDLFIISAECETTTIMDSAGGLVQKMTGQGAPGAGAGGAGMMPPAGGGGGGAAPKGPVVPGAGGAAAGVVIPGM